MSTKPLSTPVLAISAGSALTVALAALFGASELTIIAVILIALAAIGALLYLSKRSRR
ncbi:hypothetical protein [Nocardiopsis sp. JB363]|uniref:hypothetical protein n=1 Tax=Nocardiopsis sp. JB363 TaxID=1434837 RepID=UPI000979DD4D|nr:hypothetical protein [Nocardiopsis sp. JB363]SIO86159.1 hypothetical protein BQ8420_10590 [Nocardiopsis sp. JB363]